MAKNGRAPDWTDAEKAELERLYATTIKVTEIARLMRRSESAVAGAIRRMRIKRLAEYNAASRIERRKMRLPNKRTVAMTQDPWPKALPILQRLPTLMNETGIGINELSRRSGVDKQLLARLRNGYSTRIDFVLALYHALGRDLIDVPLGEAHHVETDNDDTAL